MFALVTSYYKSDDERRQLELNQCLMNNAKNPYISNIYLLNSEIYSLDFLDNEYKSKIIQAIVDERNKDRLHFDFAVQFINETLVNQNCILSNSDIYFDDTLKFIETYNFTNDAFALARYDNGLLCPGAPVSQDSWIFKSPLNVELAELKFKFGVPGCDNIFAGLLHFYGYHVYNPSVSIKTHHLHDSDCRNYSQNDRICGKYVFVSVSSLETIQFTEIEETYQ